MVMTTLLLMVPPALRRVSPKMAKKTIGAMTDLKAKKYWTWDSQLRSKQQIHAEAYLGVWDTEEW